MNIKSRLLTSVRTYQTFPRSVFGKSYHGQLMGQQWILYMWLIL